MLTSGEIINQAYETKDRTGVYFLIKDKEIIYIGCSFRIGQRLRVHYSKVDFDVYSFVEVQATRREHLQTVEAEYILKFDPKLNFGISKNDRYQSINQGLPKELGSISNEYKIEVLKNEGIEIMQSSNRGAKVKGKFTYIYRQDETKVRLCLLRNFNLLQSMQKKGAKSKKT